MELNWIANGKYQNNLYSDVIFPLLPSKVVNLLTSIGNFVVQKHNNYSHLKQVKETKFKNLDLNAKGF